MTAMCDVAFLLLSFFILATKQKPPEAVSVSNPSSVSTRVAKEEAILVTLTKDGKVYLLLGDKSHKNQIIDDINMKINFYKKKLADETASTPVRSFLSRV